MIPPHFQTLNSCFWPLSPWAFVAWRMNLLQGYWRCSVSGHTQVLGRNDPARLVPSVLPCVHSCCHLNWVGSLCLPSSSKAAWLYTFLAASSSCPLHLSVRMLWLQGTGRGWTLLRQPQRLPMGSNSQVLVGLNKRGGECLRRQGKWVWNSDLGNTWRDVEKGLW